MISEYLQEQKKYSQNELSLILGCSKNEIVPIIRKLKEYGVLKTVRKDAHKDRAEIAGCLIDTEDEAELDIGKHRNEYVVNFVGVIAIAGRILKCYPKYIHGTDGLYDKFSQVLKVIQKFNADEQIIKMFCGCDADGAFNLLAVLVYLLNDYYQYGTYYDSTEIIECNGNGEIYWDKTINETFALIYDNRPYYTNLQTTRFTYDDDDYFTQLHECILTQVSRELQDAELLDLFGFEEVELSDAELQDFGDNDYILYRIENEMNVQFDTRKQVLLKVMHAYIAHDAAIYDDDGVSLFGVTKFDIVWEKVCAEVLNNQLNTQLKTLPLPRPLRQEYDGNRRLIDLIEKPLWTATERDADDTLKPDLISIVNDNGKWMFLIFDAKYYVPKLEKGEKPEKQPGIESVTKQYLYQLAYKTFIDGHGFDMVKNCFLLPADQEHVIDGGEVVLQMMSQLGLEDIQVRFLPADLVFDNYLDGTKLDMSLLSL